MIGGSNLYKFVHEVPIIDILNANPKLAMALSPNSLGSSKDGSDIETRKCLRIEVMILPKGRDRDAITRVLCIC